jgi:hypothetical protein
MHCLRVLQVVQVVQDVQAVQIREERNTSNNHIMNNIQSLFPVKYLEVIILRSFS